MKRAEIHRLISDALEPLAEFTKGTLAGFRDDCLSDKGFWWCEEHHRFDASAKHPVDFSTDDAASARLLDAMPGPALWYDGAYWYCSPDFDKAQEMEAPDKDRKTAILLAAAKWLKIDVMELED